MLVVNTETVPGMVIRQIKGRNLFGILTLTVFGPVAEEVMKSALPLYVVEKRPFLFRSRFQLLLCAAASGPGFGIIEKLVYLNVYVPDPSPGLVKWRWKVCVALHVVCALIVGLGLARVWRDVWRRMARPRLTLLFPYLVTAIVLHGAYNGLAVLLGPVGFGF